MSKPNRLRLLVDQLGLSVSDADRLIRTDIWRRLSPDLKQVFLDLATAHLQQDIRRNDPGHNKGWVLIAPLPPKQQDHILTEVRNHLRRLIAQDAERLLTELLSALSKKRKH
ncbi:MAG: hypothetical protein OEV37_00685 [Candidatus Berkelbacteria bacterium]|nr:hypothetical protein [Candidatus Berkelbacteria bacterium]